MFLRFCLAKTKPVFLYKTIKIGLKACLSNTHLSHKVLYEKD